MKEDLFISRGGELRRKQNTLIFTNDLTTRFYPVENINAVHLFGETSLNTKILVFLSRHNVPVFVYSYYGNFCGVFAPKQESVNVKVLFAQLDSFRDGRARAEIAKEITLASVQNSLFLIRFYSQTSEESCAGDIEKISKAPSLGALRGAEGNFRKKYYRQFRSLIKKHEFKFGKRSRMPPRSRLDALISFGNSLLYNSVLTEIFKTDISPVISFYHEPRERRYSLQLDLSEMFKPVLVDNLVLFLINQNHITYFDFDKREDALGEYFYLNEHGRKVFLEWYYKNLKRRVYSRKRNQYVSYRFLIRLSVYDLINFLLGKTSAYKGFYISEYLRDKNVSDFSV